MDIKPYLEDIKFGDGNIVLCIENSYEFGIKNLYYLGSEIYLIGKWSYGSFEVLAVFKDGVEIDYTE